MISVKDCYSRRFSEEENKNRDILWKVLCSSFFQKYINNNDTVIDVGAGYCEFINNINCKRKIAIDLNPETKNFANKDVEVIQANAVEIGDQFNKMADKVFLSNFLEHLNSKEEMFQVLKKVNELLKDGGKVLILQPNIDLIKEKYWDFVDHKIPINGPSLIEALQLCGFQIETFIKKFLPYTTKNKLIPQNPFLVKMYLKIPSRLRMFSGQSFVVAKKL